MAENSDSFIINCIIADDEPFARQGMIKLVEQVPFFNLVGIAKDALEVNNYLNTLNAHLLFLDIQMPKLTGIELLKTLKNPPKVIFTTAYPEYAVEGYELDILDYLLKPVTLQRFLKAANKAKEYFEFETRRANTQLKEEDNNFFFVKTNRKLEKILFDEILFIEAMLNYVIIYTAMQKIIIYSSIKSILESLPASVFLKVHKSYIVSLSKINTIDGNQIRIKQHNIPVSRAHKEELIKAMESKRFSG